MVECEILPGNYDDLFAWSAQGRRRYTIRSMQKQKEKVLQSFKILYEGFAANKL